tara:strand:- start:440 stop:1009 length:570 start_codon:yes stop_codon:yes gene_type:complete
MYQPHGFTSLFKDIEIWKTVPEFPDYQISTFGRVWSNKMKNKKGELFGYLTCARQSTIIKGKKVYSYWNLDMTNNGFKRRIKVHRLVALFIPNPKNLPFVDHIDRDKTNNNISNLRWVTPRENNNNVDKFHSSRSHRHQFRAVVRTDLNGNVLQHYECIRDAKREYGQGAVACVYGNINTCKGFKFRFA